MTAQTLSGNRPAALKTYAQYQTTLRQELGIEPAEETAALAKRIKTKDELRIMKDERKVPSSFIIQPSSLPFVGRADEHSQLTAAFRQTVAAGANALVLIGAGGVGKTRLVHAFLEWVALDTPNVDIWQGRAFEMGGRLPYEPVIEALRLRLEQENAPEDLLEDVWLAELSQLMPELRGRYPDLPPPMTGDANFVRSRLFAAVATLGSALAAQQPAIFVLDDMQWADADSLDMIHYVARRWAESGTPILLLLTMRQGELCRRCQSAGMADAAGARCAIEAAAAGYVEWNGRAATCCPSGKCQATAQTQSQRLKPFALCLAFRNSPTGSGQRVVACPFSIEALLQMMVEQGILTLTEKAGGGYDFAAALQHVQSVGHIPLPPGVRDCYSGSFAAANRARVGSAAGSGRFGA